MKIRTDQILHLLYLSASHVRKTVVLAVMIEVGGGSSWRKNGSWFLLTLLSDRYDGIARLILCITRLLREQLLVTVNSF